MSSTSRLYPKLSGLQRPALKEERGSGRRVDDDDDPSLTADEEENFRNEEYSHEKKSTRTKLPARDGTNFGENFETSHESSPSEDAGRPRYRSRANVPSSPSKDNRISTYGQPPQDASFLGSPNGLVVISLLVILCVVVVFWWTRGAVTYDTSTSKISLVEQFVEELRTMTKLFPRQRGRLWSVIRSSVKNVFNRYSVHGDLNDTLPRERSPSVVLLLVADGEATGTLSCLVTKLANYTADVFASRGKWKRMILDINSLDLLAEAERSSNSKYWLEKKLAGFLGTKGASPVVVLRNIDVLSPEAALILHAYCDNENAPYKEAVFFFTLNCGGVVQNGSLENCSPASFAVERVDDWDKMAECCVRKGWLERGGLSVDKIAPVLSRIANDAAFVSPETFIAC